MRIVAGTALAGVVAALALVSVAAAPGAPTWGMPVRVTSKLASSPLVATNPEGDAVIGWTSYTTYDGNAEVASRSNNAQSWSEPVDLPDGTQISDLAVDGVGDAFSLVTTTSGFLQVVERVGRTGTWQPPISLSSYPFSFGGQIALGGGSVGVITTTNLPAGSVVQATVRPAGTQRWSPLEDVSDRTATARTAAIALDAAGDALAVWSEESGTVKASFRPAATGVWGSPVVLAEGFVEVQSTQVEFDAAGNATATWVAYGGGGDTSQGAVVSAYRTFGGTWEPTETISTATPFVSWPSLAVAATGDAVAVWAENGVVRATSRPASSQTWQSPTDLSQTEASYPSLATDRAGNAVAVWAQGDSIQVALRPAASREWQPPSELAQIGYVPAVAMSAAGQALAAWSDGEGIESRDLVPNGPLITGIAVPDSGTARSVTRFAVETIAWASPLQGSPVWQFGDGSSATGATVTHVYSKPGQYTVTVTQADATGSSSSTAPITVVAPSLHSLSQPSIRGVPRVGHSLFCLTGIWTGTAPIRFAYAWLRNRTVVPDAHSRRYALRRRDGGTRIACRVTAKNPAGTIYRTSLSVSVTTVTGRQH